MVKTLRLVDVAVVRSHLGALLGLGVQGAKSSYEHDGGVVLGPCERLFCDIELKELERSLTDQGPGARVTQLLGKRDRILERLRAFQKSAQVTQRAHFEGRHVRGLVALDAVEVHNVVNVCRRDGHVLESTQERRAQKWLLGRGVLEHVDARLLEGQEHARVVLGEPHVPRIPPRREALHSALLLATWSTLGSASRGRAVDVIFAAASNETHVQHVSEPRVVTRQQPRRVCVHLQLHGRHFEHERVLPRHHRKRIALDQT
mmetsp:Transcript_4231/g.13652  ORF Transcript_4231/g.13652 Transcript_4231/m.13652 type:complete len:260 (+) Transcript_4231:147-926(+)